jgi:2-methylisocitrate lyase-like PEP mutase family enzyme
MMPTPATAFSDLDDALTRITALLDMVNRGCEPGFVAQQLEDQIFRAVQAHSTLLTASDAIAEIKAFLQNTYGGQPG